ncbi:MAG: (E)-4-hydroxy-3-methylbut-2-enyl-diphosphate synthase [Lachnoclostridium sp.]|nr:(E)-4-hydroxy-3-methylbut-2-enyl-diphosphate synthase [Lachnoclostridium sp.]
MSGYNYNRRKTHTVIIGNTPLGGDNPVRVQSMTSTSTMDTEASVAQIKRIVDAGGEYVRLTAQGVREASNLAEISARLRADGVMVPLVADIHFNPKAAFEAALHVEKVRINPGNFVDPGRTFVKIDFTDEEYATEVSKIDRTLVPFLNLCRENHTAIRLGVNHGSLSDRIMSRYGDTPAGMVESVMEFLRVCRKVDFDDVVISIKASNVTVMVETVMLLVDALEKENMDYPLHLGVTEAGDGEDGRVKSAVGIGRLLADGIGDTIRVSLSEEPECEIPVAKMILDHIGKMADAPAIEGERTELQHKNRRVPIVIGVDVMPGELTDVVEIDAANNLPESVNPGATIILSSSHPNYIGSMRRALDGISARGWSNRVILKAAYNGLTADEATIAASIDLGTLLLDGYTDGVMIKADSLSDEDAIRLAFAILQATRLRMTKTEFISCPGCGRTMYDLQSTLKRIKEATSHLKGLKIGVMGCIVNGPGEMADADYGYVGSGVGKVNLYKGKVCIEKNIPTDEAIPRLIQLIKDNGDWKDA